MNAFVNCGRKWGLHFDARVNSHYRMSLFLTIVVRRKIAEDLQLSQDVIPRTRWRSRGNKVVPNKNAAQWAKMDSLPFFLRQGRIRFCTKWGKHVMNTLIRYHFLVPSTLSWGLEEIAIHYYTTHHPTPEWGCPLFWYLLSP